MSKCEGSSDGLLFAVVWTDKPRFGILHGLFAWCREVGALLMEMETIMRKSVLATCLAAALAWGAPAAADPVTINFNPDGLVGGVPTIQVTEMDQAPGATLALGVLSGGPIFVGKTFTLMYQANLQATSLNGTPNFTQGDAGLFFTYSATVDAVVTQFFPTGPGTAFVGIGLNPAGVNNNLTMYAAPAAGNNLDGVCFVCGTPILTAHAVSGSQFLTFNTNVVGNLDQTGNGDQYPAIDTIQITGSANIRFAIDTALANYFPGLNPGTMLTFAAVQTTLNAPFQQADPPFCVHSTGGGYAAGNCIGGQAGAQLGSVGATNGASGPNVLTQSDASTSFESEVQNVVPEPATMTLFGLGLLGAAVLRRRQNARK